MNNLLDNFDADLLLSDIESNLDEAEIACNTAMYDLNELTIIDTNDNTSPELKYGESVGILLNYMYDIDNSNLCNLRK